MVFLLGAPFKCSRALQEGLKMPPRWSNMFQSRPPIGPRRPTRRPVGRKRFQDAQRTLQEASPDSPREQKLLMPFGFLKDLGILTCSPSPRLPDAPRPPKRPQISPQDGPRGLQEGPKTAQEGPKTAQEASKTAQDGPRTAPRGGPDGEPERTFRGLSTKRRPGGPKKPPRAPQEAPRGPQRGPMRAPRGPQEAPRRPQ